MMRTHLNPRQRRKGGGTQLSVLWSRQLPLPVPAATKCVLIIHSDPNRRVAFKRYASMKFFDHTTCKTDKIKKTLEPKWNAQKMYSWTGVQASLLERIEAKLDVYDHDKFGMNDFMGRVSGSDAPQCCVVVVLVIALRGGDAS